MSLSLGAMKLLNARLILRFFFTIFFRSQYEFEINIPPITLR
jgi:hypothetical protein